jgi:predicted TIM-barrel fold metal-dependent hydrolase
MSPSSVSPRPAAHAPRHWPQPFIHYLNTYGQDKVLFGTDFPVISFDRMHREGNEFSA